jgi:hypothetical protein
MFSRLAAGVVLAHLLVAAVAFGQQGDSAEFGRASGGAVALTPKATNQLSLSLGLSMSHGRQFKASAGGAIVPDRLWFFGTGQFGTSTLVTSPRFSNAGLAKIAAQVGDRQNVTATSVPSSFQSLHFTGIVSSSSYFTFSASQQKTQMQIAPVVPAP